MEDLDSIVLSLWIVIIIHLLARGKTLNSSKEKELHEPEE